MRVGLTICEDIWEPGPPASDEALAGATLIVNLSASPYHAGKGLERERMLAQRARDNLAAVAFCNLVGGQDELVFDGHSLVLDHEGERVARAAQFAEELLIVDVDLEAARDARLRDARQRAPARAARGAGGRRSRGWRCPRRPATASRRPRRRPIAPLLDARRRGLRGARPRPARLRARRTASAHVVLGLSGGIDSALVALHRGRRARPRARRTSS